jgi:hypothetical protein
MCSKVINKIKDILSFKFLKEQNPSGLRPDYNWGRGKAVKIFLILRQIVFQHKLASGRSSGVWSIGRNTLVEKQHID